MSFKKSILLFEKFEKKNYNNYMKVDDLKQNKKINYNSKDSALVFLLALVLPQILFYLAIAIFGTSITENKNILSLVSAVVPQLGMLVSFFIVSQKSKVSYIPANKLHIKKINWKILLVVLAIGIICLFGFSPIVNLFDRLVESLGYKSSVSNIDVSTFSKFAVSVFFIGVLPAICEELVFRGVITNGLSEHGTTIAVVYSALLFALMHQNLQQFFYQLFLGGVMAYIVLKTGSILYTMILHFINNFVVLLTTYLSDGADSVVDYSNAWNIIYPILLAVGAVVIVLLLIKLINFIISKQQKNESLVITRENSEQVTLSQNEKSNEQQVTQSEIPAKKKWYAPLLNPYMICAVVAGVLLWIMVIISSFGK